MLDLLQMFIVLLEVFVYSVVAVICAVVIYALLQWWFDKSHSGHSPRLTQ
jgi:uncharacterized protein YggT (Ycf19 family)